MQSSGYCSLSFVSVLSKSPPLFQEELQDDPENMQEMDILDMNVLDETENDNGIPAEDDEDESKISPIEEDALLSEEQDNKTLESEDEARAPEVRN